MNSEGGKKKKEEIHYAKHISEKNNLCPKIEINPILT